MNFAIIWINELSNRALKIINSEADLNKVPQLNYLDSSGNSDAIIDSYYGKDKLHRKASKVKFNLGGKRTKNGQALIVKAEFILGELVGRIADSLWVKNDFSHYWPNPVSIPRVRNYLERCIEKEIKNNVYFATYLFWLHNQNEENLESNIFMVPLNPWGKEIKLYMQELGLKIHLFDDKSDSRIIRLMHVIKSSVYLLVSTAKLILGENNRKGLISKKEKFSENNGYKVSVPYRRSVNLEERNDLFWYKNSEIDPDNIIVSLESSAYPIGKFDLKLILDERFNAIVHDATAVALTNSVPVWRNKKLLLKMNIKRLWFLVKTAFLAFKNWEFFWQWLRLVELMKQVNYLQAYYESENIRIDIGIDPPDTSAVRAIAMDDIGGVRMGAQWSSVELKSSFLSKNDNIYFCWGRNEKHYFSNARSSINTLIITGYIYDIYINLKRSQAEKLRKELTKNGVQFIICLFDTRVTKDYTLVEDMEYYYQLFLNECLNDKSLGIIIKSKDSGVFNKLKNIDSIINEAKGTGRCLVLEEKSQLRRELWHINNIFTFLPAMASDLTVSFSISTSGTESALAGARAVYYDHMKQPDHPYYANGGKDRLIFDDQKELMSAIRRYRAGELPGLGDHSSILDEIDPFRDGKAGERIGTYIQWYLDKMNAGCDRDEAINWSNTQYAAKWGHDKVILL